MIKIITVGRVKSKNLQELIKYYQKQIPRKTEIITIKDEPTINTINKEGEAILKHIKDDEYVIALAILGNNLSSEELASMFQKLEVSSNNKITFVIGGSYGLTDDVINRANYLLSFSKMTFPHQLMQLILMEQIYRSFTIMNNHPYHK